MIGLKSITNPVEVAVHKSESPSILQIIADAASNPNIDADKMSALLTLQERIFKQEQDIALNDALARLTPQLVRLKKSKAGARTKEGAIKYFYTPREDIDTMLRPLLVNCGLSLSFTARPIDGKAWFVATVTEITKGGCKEAMMPYAPDASNSQLNDPQKVSSGLSYAERHTIAMLFNLVSEDDDDDAEVIGTIGAERGAKLESLIPDEEKQRFLNHFRVKTFAEIKTSDTDEVAIMLKQGIAA